MVAEKTTLSSQAENANMRLHLAQAYSCKKTQCYKITEEVEEQKCALKKKQKNFLLQQRRLMRDFTWALFSQESFAGSDLGPTCLKRLSADNTMYSSR